MARTIRFDDLMDVDEATAQEKAKKKDLEILVDVAGPKETETKTLCVKMNVFGLLSLRFKEGGQLPGCLTGDFTGIEEVRSALDIWRNQRHKEFVLDPEIERQKAAQAPNPAENPEKTEGSGDVVDTTGANQNQVQKKPTLSLNK